MNMYVYKIYIILKYVILQVSGMEKKATCLISEKKLKFKGWLSKSICLGIGA